MMNSAMAGCAAILPFDTETDPNSMGMRWTKWIQRFENVLVAVNIVNEGRKKAFDATSRRRTETQRHLSMC